MSRLSELEEAVGKWHRETYGEMTPKLRTAMDRKWDEEQDELRDAGPCELPQEAADCLIVLLTFTSRFGWTVQKADALAYLTRLANHEGFDLLAEAERKLEKVKGRDQLQRDRERGLKV